MGQFFQTIPGIVVIAAMMGAAIAVIGWSVFARAQVAAEARLQGRAAEQAAHHLAVQTVIALDDFVGACHAAAYDRPDFNPADPGDFMFHMGDPALVLPKEADWSLLTPELVDEMLWMPYRIRNVMDGLESLELEPPGLDRFFEHRQEDFAKLGLRALDLIDKIVDAYDLTPPERPTYYDPRQGLQTKADEIAALRGRRHWTQMDKSGETSNVTALFNATTRQPPRREPDGDASF